MEVIGILPRYNTMECQLQSMHVRYLTRYMLQNVCCLSGIIPSSVRYISYSRYNYMKLSGIEM